MNYVSVRSCTFVKLMYELSKRKIITIRKLREGNVFTPVCHSVHRRGLCPGGSLSRGLSVQRGFLSKGLSVKGGLCPEGVSVQRGVSVQGDLCQGDPPYGNVQAVSILLECIFVCYIFCTGQM